MLRNKITLTPSEFTIYQRGYTPNKNTDVVCIEVQPDSVSQGNLTELGATMIKGLAQILPTRAFKDIAVQQSHAKSCLKDIRDPHNILMVALRESCVESMHPLRCQGNCIDLRRPCSRCNRTQDVEVCFLLCYGISQFTSYEKNTYDVCNVKWEMACSSVRGMVDVRNSFIKFKHPTLIIKIIFRASGWLRLVLYTLAKRFSRSDQIETYQGLKWSVESILKFVKEYGLFYEPLYWAGVCIDTTGLDLSGVTVDRMADRYLRERFMALERKHFEDNDIVWPNQAYYEGQIEEFKRKEQEKRKLMEVENNSRQII